MSLLTQATKKLEQAGIETARLDSLVLLEHISGQDRSQLLAGVYLTSEKEQVFENLLELRSLRTPLAYLVGYKEFYGRKFTVSPDVLIPRPESEDMIDLLKEQGENIETVIDLGCGSGCLGITAKLEQPNLRVVLVDISELALKIAKSNATTLQADVELLQSDLLADVTLSQSSALLANLPYVPTTLPASSPELNAEPELAMYSGADGLDHYRVFFEQLLHTPNKPKIFIVESLREQQPTLAKIAEAAGYSPQEHRGLASCFVLARKQ